MYNRYEAMTISNGYYHRKYTTFFAGEYDENTINYAGSTSVSIVIGCKIYGNLAGLSDSTPYGLCMRGWLQYVEGEVATTRYGYI
jgi:hypothetical protein